jgi:hypothetical protein
VENPFRIHGVVSGPYFTDRASEVARIARAMRTPAAKLLVLGPRRMGKTSAIAVARESVERRGTLVIATDFATVSSLADCAGRILESATRKLGRRWRDVIDQFAQRLQGGVRVTADPTTGRMTASLDIAARRGDEGAQHRSFGHVLDTIEALAKERGKRIAIVLDEFQEIHAVAGERGEWLLRNLIQHHEHVSYVLAGSKLSLIRDMLGTGRALYQFVDPLELGSIDAEHLARWIDSRMATAGLHPDGAGGACVALAGPRTQDVIQLAHRIVELTRHRGRGKESVTDALIGAAFDELVATLDVLITPQWEALTRLQQNVLRAVAGARDGLTTGEVIAQFGLGSTGAATNAAKALLERELLVKAGEGPSGYAFDSPFVRGWVVCNALPDVGILQPVTYLPRAR